MFQEANNPSDLLSPEQTWIVFVDKCSYVAPQMACLQGFAELAEAAGSTVKLAIGETIHGYREKTDLSAPEMPSRGYKDGKKNKFADFHRKNRRHFRIFETKDCNVFRDCLYEILEKSVMPLVDRMVEIIDEGKTMKPGEEFKVPGTDISLSEDRIREMGEGMIETVFNARRYLSGLQHRPRLQISMADVKEAISKNNPKTLQILRDSADLWKTVIKPHNKVKSIRKDRGEKSVLRHVGRLNADDNVMITFITDDGGAIEEAKRLEGVEVPFQVVTKRGFVAMIGKMFKPIYGEVLGNPDRPPPEIPESDDIKILLREMRGSVQNLKSKTPRGESHAVVNIKKPRIIDPSEVFMEGMRSALSSTRGLTR